MIYEYANRYNADKNGNLYKEFLNSFVNLNGSEIFPLELQLLRHIQLLFFALKSITQSAKDMGPTRALYGILYGPCMGTPYGTEMGFATRFHVVPAGANPYGSQMGTIWVLFWIWPKWPMFSQPL